jgi:predicted molibdopterin-dependent oxidoreductase YjgC
MFRPLDITGDGAVSIEVEGQSRLVPMAPNLAAALLSAGFSPFRTTPAGAAPRQPYCMMGVCFDCLVEIDGVPNRQACLESVREGMRVRRQRGAADIGEKGGSR